MEKNLFLNVAAYYDFDPRGVFTEDIPFYLEYSNNTSNKKVLELACGTGRITIPIARSGCHITGLDLSDSMLAVLNSKLDQLPDIQQKVTIVKGNMSNFNLNEKFDLIIIPFRALQVLTTEDAVKTCLNCVKDHLADNGIFIFDVFSPYKNLDENWVYAPKIQWEAINHLNGHKIIKFDEGYKIDIENQIIFVKQTYREESNGQLIQEADDFLKMKYYYNNQLRSLILENSFKIMDSFGWYDKTPIVKGKEMIFVCSK